MRRTRKWAYVAQEAQRLADLGLSAADIARRLEVHWSTVDRWIKSGKLMHGESIAKGRPGVPPASPEQTVGQWSAEVRRSYALDVTDGELVSLAEDALKMARDPNSPPSLQLQAMGRYQQLVKQLALVARAAAEAKPEEPKRKVIRAVRTGTDPRGILTGL